MNSLRICAIFSLLALHQAALSQTLTDADVKKILADIERGDINALGVAAESGNKAFVSCFKEQLQNPKKKLHGASTLLQTGLAKMGEVEQLQQISCELNFGNASDRFYAMRKMKSVGGWFAISNMAEFLKNDPKYTHVFGDGLGRLQDYALQFLPPLVPPPPPEPEQTSRVDQSAAIKVWTEYFDSNKDALHRLEPTGEGVQISEKICENVLKHDPAKFSH